MKKFFKKLISYNYSLVDFEIAPKDIVPSDAYWLTFNVFIKFWKIEWPFPVASFEGINADELEKQCQDYINSKQK